MVNIYNELFLPPAPDKSCIHRSLLLWSLLLDVFCRRLETCTTSSWWASGERRRWRCLMMTWRTLSTARTQRTQVPHAHAWSHFESVRVRESCSPEDESQRAFQTSDGQVWRLHEWQRLPHEYLVNNKKAPSADTSFTDLMVGKSSWPCLAAKNKNLYLPLTYHLGSMHGKK